MTQKTQPHTQIHNHTCILQTNKHNVHHVVSPCLAKTSTDTFKSTANQLLLEPIFPSVLLDVILLLSNHNHLHQITLLRSGFHVHIATLLFLIHEILSDTSSHAQCTPIIKGCKWMGHRPFRIIRQQVPQGSAPLPRNLRTVVAPTTIPVLPRDWWVEVLHHLPLYTRR